MPCLAVAVAGVVLVPPATAAASDLSPSLLRDLRPRPIAQAAKRGKVTVTTTVAPQAQLFLRTGSGYSVSVEGTGRTVALTVERGLTFATYVTRGRASPNAIRARFGHFGRVSVRFKPSGRPRKEPPPKRCRGNAAIVRRGVFVGTIRFRGEEHYLGMDAKRAKGSSSTLPRWRCGGRRLAAGASARAKKLRLDAAELKASTPHERIVFDAFGLRERGGGGALVFFLVATKERRGSVRIARVGLAISGRGRTFAFDRSLRSATVRPPKPFHGSATFERGPRGSTAWAGTLSVSLPGAQVPLTGPSFKARLTEP